MTLTNRRSLIKEFFKRADILLLIVCVISSVFGIIAISSATANIGSGKYIIVQTFSLFLGLVAFFIFTIIDPDVIAKQWLPLSILSAIFILGLIPFGHDDGTGNRAWYRFLSIGVQPTEVVKVVFIVLLAKQISNYKEQKILNKPKSVVLLAAHWAAMFVIIMVASKDMGSAVIFLAIFIVMLIAGGLAWYWIGIGAAAAAAATPILWNNMLQEYQRNRILVPYDPTIDPTGEGIRWQANRTIQAMEAGRWDGVGYGNGSLNIDARHTDCIFASIGEEMGMIACLVVIALLMFIIIRCCVVGTRCGSNFGMLICYGVAAAIAFQTFINIGMCMGITPVIGITLPFFSYGGSSIVTLFAAVGLVSGVKFRPKPKRHNINTIEVD